jgi:glycosyltransferase involved in cell wall biosynthesis
MAEVDVQQQQPEALGHADIVLSVFSHNSAGTIGNMVRAGQEALATYFPESRGIVVNLDGGSKDGTQEIAMEAAIDKKSFLQLANPVPLLSVEQYGMPNKVSAYKTIFDLAGTLKARACIVLDGNISSFNGEWVEALGRPVFDQQFDFVAPCYQRHKYDAPILQGIVYPLTRALYGKRIRQPIGGDFAFSVKLLDYLTRQRQADADGGGFGMDAWISTRASCGDFRLAQAYLGPRILTQSEPPPEVSTMLAQVLGSVFTQMNETASIWQRIRHSDIVPTFGSGCEPVSDPEEVPVDIHPMIESFRLGYENLQDIWRVVLPPATLVELKRMASKSPEAFCFDDVLWARVIYDFALAYRLRSMDRDHLLRALTPIYLGWVASYVVGVRGRSPNEAQDSIEALCLAYEAQKGYLISRWRWPDRFNP